MTKAELIEALKGYDGDEKIYFAYDSGDYWHHILVKPVEEIEFELVKYSEYSQSLIINSNEDDVVEECLAAVVLR